MLLIAVFFSRFISLRKRPGAARIEAEQDGPICPATNRTWECEMKTSQRAIVATCGMRSRSHCGGMAPQKRGP